MLRISTPQRIMFYIVDSLIGIRTAPVGNNTTLNDDVPEVLLSLQLVRAPGKFKWSVLIIIYLNIYIYS